MSIRTSDDISDEYYKQKDDSAVRAWRTTNGWSTLFSANPEEIFMLLEELDDDLESADELMARLNSL